MKERLRLFPGNPPAASLEISCETATATNVSAHGSTRPASGHSRVAEGWAIVSQTLSLRLLG